MTHQKIILIGNLGSDPQFRNTPNSKAVTQFSLATNRRWTGADGQLQEETVWFQISVWGKQAEACHTYLQKGQLVLVEGRLTVDRQSGGPRVWTDQNGSVRASFEVTASGVRFLGQTPEGGHDSETIRRANGDEIPF